MDQRSVIQTKQTLEVKQNSILLVGLIMVLINSLHSQENRITVTLDLKKTKVQVAEMTMALISTLAKEVEVLVIKTSTKNQNQPWVLMTCSVKIYLNQLPHQVETMDSTGLALIFFQLQLKSHFNQRIHQEDCKTLIISLTISQEAINHYNNNNSKLCNLLQNQKSQSKL
jgi:hypothetical protein